MDLAEWHVAGRWVGLLELIDNLPTACRLNEAIADDPEDAREIALLPKPTDPWSPKVSEFDLNAILQRNILGALTGIQQVLVAANGGNPTPQKPFPAPYTAIDRAIAAVEREFAEDLAGRFGFDPDDI